MNPFKRTFHFIHHHPLAKRHLLKAYRRFLTWQILSRLYPKLIKWPFIENVSFYAKKQLTGITGNIYTGLHEFKDMAFLIHYLKKEDRFMDIGANVGSYTLLATGLKKCKTIAFEPVSSTFNILKKNILLNNIEDKAVCYQKCVGSNHEIVNFTFNEDTANHIEPIATKATFSVETVRVDDFLKPFNPTILKIDVEGFETEVLNGAAKTLSNKELNVIIIELNGSGGRYGYKETEIHDKLLSFSFTPYEYFPFERNLRRMDNFENLNTIYIRNIELANKRVTQSRKFKIFSEWI